MATTRQSSTHKSGSSQVMRRVLGVVDCNKADLSTLIRGLQRIKKARDEWRAIQRMKGRRLADVSRCISTMDLLLKRAGARRRDIGATNEQIQKKLKEADRYLALTAWETATRCDIPSQVTAHIRRMDQLLTRSGLRRSSIKVTEASVQEAYLDAARRNWKELCEYIYTELDAWIENMRKDIRRASQEAGAHRCWRLRNNMEGALRHTQELIQRVRFLIRKARASPDDIGATDAQVRDLYAALAGKFWAASFAESEHCAANLEKMRIALVRAKSDLSLLKIDKAAVDARLMEHYSHMAHMEWNKWKTCAGDPVYYSSDYFCDHDKEPYEALFRFDAFLRLIGKTRDAIEFDETVHASCCKKEAARLTKKMRDNAFFCSQNAIGLALCMKEGRLTAEYLGLSSDETTRFRQMIMDEAADCWRQRNIPRFGFSASTAAHIVNSLLPLADATHADIGMTEEEARVALTSAT